MPDVRLNQKRPSLRPLYLAMGAKWRWKSLKLIVTTYAKSWLSTETSGGPENPGHPGRLTDMTDTNHYLCFLRLLPDTEIRGTFHCVNSARSESPG